MVPENLVMLGIEHSMKLCDNSINKLSKQIGIQCRNKIGDDGC
jgi:hypothetical protein